MHRVSFVLPIVISISRSLSSFLGYDIIDFQPLLLPRVSRPTTVSVVNSNTNRNAEANEESLCAEKARVIRQPHGGWMHDVHIDYALSALLALYKANADQRGHSSSVRSRPRTLYHMAT